MMTTEMEVVVAGRIVHTVAVPGGGLLYLKGLCVKKKTGVKYKVLTRVKSMSFLQNVLFFFGSKVQ